MYQPKEDAISTEQKKYVPRPLGSLSVDKLLPFAGNNVFRLMRMSMLRALELAGGSPSLVDNIAPGKTVTLTFEEIAQGKISYVKENLKRVKKSKKEDE